LGKKQIFINISNIREEHPFQFWSAVVLLIIAIFWVVVWCYNKFFYPRVILPRNVYLKLVQEKNDIPLNLIGTPIQIEKDIEVGVPIAFHFRLHQGNKKAPVITKVIIDFPRTAKVSPQMTKEGWTWTKTNSGNYDCPLFNATLTSGRDYDLPSLDVIFTDEEEDLIPISYDIDVDGIDPVKWNFLIDRDKQYERGNFRVIDTSNCATPAVVQAVSPDVKPVTSFFDEEKISKYYENKFMEDNVYKITVARVHINRFLNDYDTDVDNLIKQHIEEGSVIAYGKGQGGNHVQAHIDHARETKRKIDEKFLKLTRDIEDELLTHFDTEKLANIEELENEYSRYLEKGKELKEKYDRLTEFAKSWEVRILGELRFTKDLDLASE